MVIRYGMSTVFFLLVGACAGGDQGERRWPVGGGDTGGDADVPGGDDEVIVSAALIVLDSSALAAMNSVSDDLVTLVFGRGVAAIDTLTAGRVLAAEVTPRLPQGMLRRVTQVTADDTTITVTTAPATLEDALEKARVARPLTLTSADVTEFSGLSGVFPSGVKQAGESAIELHQVELEAGSGIYANGYVDFDIELELSMEIAEFRVQRIDFVHTTSFDASLTISSETGGSFGHRFRVGRMSFAPLVVPVGPLPVVLTPVLDLYVGLDGELSAAMVMNANAYAAVELGVRYDGRWHPVNSWESVFGFSAPSGDATGVASAWVGPELGVLIYGVVGPYASLRGYVELDAALLPAGLQWALYAGLRAGIGVKVEALGVDITRFEISDLLDLRKQLAFHAAGDPPRWNVETVARAAHLDPAIELAGLATAPDGALHLLYSRVPPPMAGSVGSTYHFYAARLENDAWGAGATSVELHPGGFAAHNAFSSANGLGVAVADDIWPTPDAGGTVAGISVWREQGAIWSAEAIPASLAQPPQDFLWLEEVAPASNGGLLAVAAIAVSTGGGGEVWSVRLFREDGTWDDGVVVDNQGIEIAHLCAAMSAAGDVHLVYTRLEEEPSPVIYSTVLVHAVIDGTVVTLHEVERDPDGSNFLTGNGLALAGEAGVAIFTRDIVDGLVLYEGGAGSYARSLVDTGGWLPLATAVHAGVPQLAFLKRIDATQTDHLFFGVRVDEAFQNEWLDDYVKERFVSLAIADSQVALAYVRKRGSADSELRVARRVLP